MVAGTGESPPSELGRGLVWVKSLNGRESSLKSSVCTCTSNFSVELLGMWSSAWLVMVKIAKQGNLLCSYLMLL